jgi:hypothetical protein
VTPSFKYIGKYCVPFTDVTHIALAWEAVMPVVTLKVLGSLNAIVGLSLASPERPMDEECSP